jgi:carboxymethylenebutenolidase
VERNDERILSMHAGYESAGRHVDAYLARPYDGVPRPGVILLSGMFGLTWTQRELTRLYARAGFVALSPDFLNGRRPRNRWEGLDAKNALDVPAAVQQLGDGADFLRGLPWVASDAGIGIMGFCLGGGLALLALTDTDRFGAGVIFHQSLFPDPRDLARLSGPVIGHYGTADTSTPPEEVEAFVRELDAAGRRYELHWYEGMAHSFAQIAPDADVPPDQRAAADLAHERSFEFLRRELAGASPATPVRSRRGS